MEKTFGRRKPVTGSAGRRTRPSGSAHGGVPERSGRRSSSEKRVGKEYGEGRPFGERKPFDGRKPFGERKSFGGRKPAGERSFSGERKFAGERSFSGERKFAGGRKPFGDRKPFGGRRFSGEEAAGERKYVRRPVASEWTPTDEYIRLNRFISNSGVCSRREADEFIQTGLVSVNGTVVTELGTKVKMTDDIRFNGERLKGEKRVYIVMNKPKGYVTTVDDPHADKTVMDLISKTECPQRVYPVGRLDKATTGVLMFTNDGEISERLTHPSFNKKKIYQVILDHPLSIEDHDRILKGIALSDGEVNADELEFIDEQDHRKLGIEIHSGKNRIVRRIFESLGYDVRALDRVYFAGLTKKGLKKGEWRFLTEGEVNILKMGSYV